MKALSHPKTQWSDIASDLWKHPSLRFEIIHSCCPPQKTSGKKRGTLISGVREETDTFGQNIDRCPKFMEEMCFAEVVLIQAISGRRRGSKVSLCIPFFS